MARQLAQPVGFLLTLPNLVGLLITIQTRWVTGNFARLSHSHTTAEIAWIDNGNTNVSLTVELQHQPHWVLAKLCTFNIR